MEDCKRISLKEFKEKFSIQVTKTGGFGVYNFRACRDDRLRKFDGKTELDAVKQFCEYYSIGKDYLDHII